MDTEHQSPLPFEEWPEADRSIFQAAAAGADDAEDLGCKPVIEWMPRTYGNVVQHYGQWLRFLHDEAPERLAWPPGDRPDKETIDAFVQTLRTKRQMPRSIGAKLQHITRMLRTLAPGCDWRWLGRKGKRWSRSAAKVRDTTRVRPHPRDLYDNTLKAFARTAERGDLHPYTQAKTCRDYLMVATLIARPWRAGTLRCIDVAEHLRFDANGVYATFGENDEKNGRATEWILPSRLGSALETYLEDFRPVLCRWPGQTDLWPGKDGPLSYSQLRIGVMTATERLTGERIRPHLFRYIASTAAALEGPETVKAIPELLEHEDPRTMSDYYIVMNRSQASKKYNNALDDIIAEYQTPYN